MSTSPIRSDIKKSLVKLLAVTAVLVGLISECFYQNDPGLVGVMAVVAAVLVFPVVILSSIDASRAIKKDMSTSKSTRVFGDILGIPQAIIGILLMAIGIAYPFIGIQNIVINFSSGRPIIFQVISTMIALMMLLVGYYYFREGLSFN